MSTIHLVTGDTAAGDLEARQERQRGNGAGAAYTYTMFPINAEDLTPDDDEIFDVPSAIYVGGGGGNVVVTPWGGGSDVTYALETGQWVPVMVRRVDETSTATGLIRHW